MYRWPLELTPLSLASRGVPREAVLEITSRGAAFTLAALCHVGHPVHLALIDAYLKGQVRGTIGDDSRAVAASLATPLVLAHEIGLEQLTLHDLTLLRPGAEIPNRHRRTVHGENPDVVRRLPLSRKRERGSGGEGDSGEGPHLALRAGTTWHEVRVADRFEGAGCHGTTNVGVSVPWHEVIVALPDPPVGRSAPILAEVREPSLTVPNVADPQHSTPATRTGSVVTAESDGYQTLYLPPPPGASLDVMREAAWETVEGLIGRSLPERRTEPIVMRLVGPVLTTTLDVGESVVIGRNQSVFAAWVGSDGRVMIRLFPPGGMPSPSSGQ